MSSSQLWSSPFSSWHTRALLTPHPNPNTFSPTREALLLAVLRNAQVEPEGFTLAIFSSSGSGGIDTSDSVAIDALGRVLEIPASDSAGILGLAQKILQLPQTDSWRNTWVIRQERTGQPIDRLFIPSPSISSFTSDLSQISVQGFSKQKRELKSSVVGMTDLPDALWELTGLVLEARDGTHDGGEGQRRDNAMLGKVRDVLEDLF